MTPSGTGGAAFGGAEVPDRLLDVLLGTRQRFPTMLIDEWESAMTRCPFPAEAIALGDRYLSSPEQRAVPYSTYAELRRAAPVLRTSSGTWLVTGHPEALAVLADDAGWSRREAAVRHAVVHEGATRDIFNSKLAAHDQPAHRRLRQLVAKALSPASVRLLEPRIREICVELLDRVAPDGRMDLVRRYGYPLPERIIAELFGMSAHDVERVEAWANDIMEVPPGGDIESARDRATSAFTAYADYVRAEVATRRAAPGEDLLSRLIAVEEEGTRLSENELIGITWELILAGHETTAKLIPNGVAHLLSDPAHVSALRAQPGRVASAVEEVLRFDSSAHMCLPRVARRDIPVGDQVIPEGDSVIVVVGAANRDERVFSEPERFDPARDSRDHLGFGFGAHFCIGHTLARAEARIAIEELLLRFPDLELDEPGRVTWAAGNMTRGVVSLPVRWRPVS